MDTQAEPQVDTDLRALITLASFYQFTAEELQIQHRLSVHCELLNAEQVLHHLMPILMRFRKHIEALFQPVLTYYISREEQKNRIYFDSYAFAGEEQYEIYLHQSLEKSPNYNKVTLKSHCLITCNDTLRKKQLSKLMMVVISHCRNWEIFLIVAKVH